MPIYNDELAIGGFTHQRSSNGPLTTKTLNNK